MVLPLLAAAALLGVFTALAAPNTTFTVTNTNDSGAGSLRKAIDDAKDNPGTDTITFAAATDGIPIVLAGAAGEDANASGDLDILNGGDLTIQGNGAANTIIDGGGIDRVFHVCPIGECANTITLTGVTVRNGSVSGAGGGIYNRYSTLTITNSTLISNTADCGGGIYNLTGTTTVNASTVSANTAEKDLIGQGGGIYNSGGVFTHGTLNIQNGSIVNANTASGDGGGIYNGGTLTMNGSTVSANTGALSGGGIYNGGTLNIQNGSTVSANTADYYGGGIHTSGTLTVDHSIVSANTASKGGGIYNRVTLNITNSTIGGAGAGNTAYYGGGIFNTSGYATTTVNGSTISANTANVYGGGILNEATLNVQNGSTIGGDGAGNTAYVGGGIYNRDGTATVNGSTVSANTATYLTGGIYNYDGTTTVTGSRILNNTADDGGGVYNREDVTGATSVTDSCFVGNSATSYLNDQPAEQIATDNWWGAATGPNTPGADTVDGNVDTSGYLTEPILGCGFGLTVSRAGTGSGSVTSTPAGIVCGDDCSESYDYGTVVTLTATANTGSTFTGWGGACSGTADCVVTMDAAKSVTATFTGTVYDVFLPIIMK